MSEQIKYPILGQEAVVGRDGLGRVTEIGPADRCGSGNPEWIGVTPYAGRTWQMNFAPHNVRLIPIEDTQCGELRAEVERLRAVNEMLVADLVMIERMAAGAIYSQEAIHAQAAGALKRMEDGR
jgi:hypothetical protein